MTGEELLVELDAEIAALQIARRAIARMLEHPLGNGHPAGVAAPSPPPAPAQKPKPAAQLRVAAAASPSKSPPSLPASRPGAMKHDYPAIALAMVALVRREGPQRTLAIQQKLGIDANAFHKAIQLATELHKPGGTQSPWQLRGSG